MYVIFRFWFFVGFLCFSLSYSEIFHFLLAGKVTVAISNVFIKVRTWHCSPYSYTLVPKCCLTVGAIYVWNVEPDTRNLSPKSRWQLGTGLESLWLIMIQHPCHQGKEINTAVKWAERALMRVVNERKVAFILMVQQNFFSPNSLFSPTLCMV